MRAWIVRRRFPLAFLALAALVASLAAGCKMISDSLSRWQMLDQQALEDPLQAVGGDAIVFAPQEDDAPLDTDRLAKASPQDLVAYYSPVFIQQRVNTAAQPHPYPPEYDQIGQACLRRDKGGLKAFVAGSPIIYAIYQKLPIGGHDHIQLTYTAWYPAHPRMKAIDLEEADIDSCVVRVTLDEHNAPLFFETIAACGCFHKVFVEKRVEDAAAKAFGPPEQGKKYSVERTLKDAIDWEVAGVVEEPPDRPRRPVVFVKAGDHKVIRPGQRVAAARAGRRRRASLRPHGLPRPLFRSNRRLAGARPVLRRGRGRQGVGRERKERFVLGLVGVDSAGQPRANDQIKMHFDQSTWGDTTTYERFLRLPPGTL